MSDVETNPESEIRTTSETSADNKKRYNLDSPYIQAIGRISRITLYILGVWSILLYYWSFIGLAIGIGIILVSKEPAWRRHGIVLAYSIGLMTGLMGDYAWLLSLIVILFLIIYLLGSVVIQAIRLTITGVRILLKKQVIKPDSETKSESRIDKFLLKSLGGLSSKPKIMVRIKMIVTLIVLISPVILWSNVNLDLEVMFDNNPTLLWVHAPSMMAQGDEFELIVEAWDSFERLSANYHGTVMFSIVSYNLTTGDLLSEADVSLPGDYTFTGGFLSSGIIPAYMLAGPEDYGLHSFSASIDTEGIHYILVEDSLTQNVYWSNPIVVDDLAESAPMIYWGDLHAHSMVSDGSGTADESYYYGRYIAGLDYMALTDHGEHFTMFDRTKEGNADFENYKLSTSNAYEPDEFVSFFGAEWTTNYAIQPLLFVPVPSSTGGHYTCVFSGDSLPLFSTFTENTVDELWTVLDDFTASTGTSALAIPHHTIRSMFIQDWTLMNPKYVKLAEVTSVHGESLFDNELNYMGSVDLPLDPVSGSSIIDALNMGYRMSFTANGDNHDGHPGHSISHTRASIGHQYPYTLYNARNGHPYPSGITAVYANSLTRADVFNGLENGRVYANSDFGRPILNFTINDIPVEFNSTVSVATSTTPRELTIFLAQDGAPAAGKDHAATVSVNWMPNWNVDIEIIKNGQIWETIQISTPISMISIFDNSTITGTSYDGYILGEDGNYYINERSTNPIDPASLNTDGMDYYAIRVVGANGRTSYIGPIWVNSP